MIVLMKCIIKFKTTTLQPNMLTYFRATTQQCNDILMIWQFSHYFQFLVKVLLFRIGGCR